MDKTTRPDKQVPKPQTLMAKVETVAAFMREDGISRGNIQSYVGEAESLYSSGSYDDANDVLRFMTDTMNMSAPDGYQFGPIWRGDDLYYGFRPYEQFKLQTASNGYRYYCVVELHPSLVGREELVDAALKARQT